MANSIGAYSQNSNDIGAYESAGSSVDHALTATSISSTSNVTTSAITQAQALLANDISSLSSLSQPTCSSADHQLNANDLNMSTELTQPTIGGFPNGYPLTAPDLSSLSETATTAISQHHNLGGRSIESVSEAGDPVFMDGTWTEEEWWIRRHMLYRNQRIKQLKKGIFNP